METRPTNILAPESKRLNPANLSFPITVYHRSDQPRVDHNSLALGHFDPTILSYL